MPDDKRKKLEAAGWRFGTAAEFLQLSDEEAARVDSKLPPRDSFNCRRCQATYTPSADQWIFYKLCDACFTEFDMQKMRGRFSGKRAMFNNAPQEVLAALHLNSMDEIPEQPQPYFESCDEWLKWLVAKGAAP